MDLLSLKPLITWLREERYLALFGTRLNERKKQQVRRKSAANKGKDIQGKVACRIEMNTAFRMES